MLTLNVDHSIEWADFGYLPYDFVHQELQSPGQHSGNHLQQLGGRDVAIKNILRSGIIESSEPNFTGRIRLLGKRSESLRKITTQLRKVGTV